MNEKKTDQKFDWQTLYCGCVISLVESAGATRLARKAQNNGRRPRGRTDAAARPDRRLKCAFAREVRDDVTIGVWKTMNESRGFKIG